MSRADDSTEDEGAVEAISDLSAMSLDSSSTDVVSRSGDDMERLLVGECWLRFAPRRLRVGVGESDTSVSVSVVVVMVVSVVLSDTMVLAGSSTTLVSIFISWLRRRLRRLLPLPPLRGRASSAGSSFDSVDVVTSDAVATALGGSSRVDIDSREVGLRRESFSTKGSGVPLSHASSLVP
jgi:hypothetical protein